MVEGYRGVKRIKVRGPDGERMQSAQPFKEAGAG